MAFSGAMVSIDDPGGQALVSALDAFAWDDDIGCSVLCRDSPTVICLEDDLLAAL